MHQYLPLLVGLVASAVLSWFFCGLVRRQLIKGNRFDTPNERSLHTGTVPRGGGWGVWLSFFIAFGITWLTLPDFSGLPSVNRWPFIIGLLALIFISWLDDRKPLSPIVRIIVHIGAVVVGFMEFPPDALLFQGLLPFWADRLIAGIAWVWMINLTNFMDGMDGLTGSETIHISLGIIAVCFMASTAIGAAPLYALLLIGTMIGFLVWNWHPAKLFLGDVGSIPLGYMLGYMLLRLAMEGYWAIALALPLYYLADATITLVKRLLRGEKFWQAHREHFYQRAALRVGHKPVLFMIISTNLLLLGLCISSLQVGLWVLTGAPLVVALLLWYLNDMATKTRA